MRSKVLIGIKLQVSSNTGLKAITGSESYILENTVDNKYVAIISICYALIMIIRLMLHSIKTVIYFDASKIDFDRKKKKEADSSPYNPLFLALEKCFSTLEYSGVSKGKHIETLRRKLNDLSQHDTNEITSGDLSDILQRISKAEDFNY